MFGKYVQTSFFNRRSIILFLSTAFVICAFLTNTIPDAYALLSISIDDGVSTPILVNDEGTGDASPGQVGVVSFSGSIGSFPILTVVGNGTPILTPGTMDLFVSVTIGSGALVVKLTETDVSDPNSQSEHTLDAGGSTPGTVNDVSCFIDAGNVAFGEGIPGPALGPFGPGAYDGSGSSSLSNTGTYSRTIKSEITHPGGITVLDAESNVLGDGGNGGEGGTPGFWKRHLEWWVGYEPDDSYSAIFGVTPSFIEKKDRFDDVLSQGGGGEKALARHAVAGLLNAAHPGVNYLFTGAEVIALVQDAYATGDFGAAKDILETENERGVDL